MTATDRLLSQAELHPDWPLNDDMVHPLHCDLSRKPPWRDPVAVDVSSRWCEDWQSAKAMSSSLVDDPTVRAPGFYLRQRQWSLLNRFRTGQGHCGTCRKKWGLTDNEIFDCGRHPDNVSIMSVIASCPLTKLDRGLQRLHATDNAAVDWLTSYVIMMPTTASLLVSSLFLARCCSITATSVAIFFGFIAISS